MKIADILQTKATISFEVFPPKNKNGDLSSIYATIDELANLNPDFISVTYGAGGSTKGQTMEIASYIKQHGQIEALAHLTCMSASVQEIDTVLGDLAMHQIDNILALRGDYPRDHSLSENDLAFMHASDLMNHIREHHGSTFCLAGACYPEGHQEANSFVEDLQMLKAKQDAGASFLITQIFYDNQYYYRLKKEARKRGITIPIIAGIMPVTNGRSLLHTAKMCGCSIPYDLSTMIASYDPYPQAMKEIGINYATSQIIDLITNGVDGIHIYTMNKPEIARAIFQAIPTVLKELHHE